MPPHKASTHPADTIENGNCTAIRHLPGNMKGQVLTLHAGMEYTTEPTWGERL